MTLLEGERDANTKKILKNYVLHIDTKNWSEKSKSYVLSQLQFSRNESIDAATLKKPDKAYIFFLGERESLNDFKFHVNDHRLIYSIVTTITY